MTVFNFVPSQQAPFQFNPTLDGQVYTVIVTWNLFGARYYVNIYALDGTLVVALPLIGSPDGVLLSALAWQQSGALVTATTSAPHGRKLGQTVDLTISGASPDAYNGTFECLVTGPDTFTYLVADDPGPATAFGTATYDISLTAGYFASTLVFRQASQQFEVSP